MIIIDVARGATLRVGALLPSPRLNLRAVSQEHLHHVDVAVVRGVVDGLVPAKVLRVQSAR